MDWFRWWHGTVTDPKFRSIARKAECSVADVLAVWACLLEHASSVTELVTQCDASVTRGSVTRFCCDDYDVLLGLPDGTCQTVYDHMETKGLISAGRVASWGQRQPKREDSSKTRTKEWRERKKQQSVTQCDAGVTQCDAPETETETDIIEPPPPTGAPPYENPAYENAESAETAESVQADDQRPVNNHSPPANKPPPANRQTRLPTGFVLSDRMRENANEYWARMNRYDLDADNEFETFYAHYDDRPEERRADWEKTWCTWYQRAVKFSKRQANGGTSKTTVERLTDRSWAGLKN